MQYPVPQFTEVEDKLIGSLTLKQFGIVAVAGVLIFAGYSATKSVLVLIFLFMLFGVPALGLAFIPLNGRPVYLQLNHLITFLFAPKQLVFHKQVLDFSSTVKLTDLKLPKETVPALSPQDTQSRIKEVQTILKRQQEEEEQLAKKV